MTDIIVRRRRSQDAWPGTLVDDIRTVPPLRATPALDAICRRHTAFRSLLELLTQPAGYRPSIRLDLTHRSAIKATFFLYSIGIGVMRG